MVCNTFHVDTCVMPECPARPDGETCIAVQCDRTDSKWHTDHTGTCAAGCTFDWYLDVDEPTLTEAPDDK